MDNIPKEWKKCVLEELLDYIQPSKYIVESTEYNDKFLIPVLTAGKTFILGYTDEKENIFDELPVIIFDDFTTATKFVNFKFKVKSSAMKILIPISKIVNIKYIYYYMQTIRQNVDTHKRYWISIYSKLIINLPPLAEQKEILSRIEELFSELDNGIENLKKAKEQIKTYRQSLLKNAFEGKLTEKWRKENPDKIEKWETKKMADISKVSGGLTKNSNRNSLPNKYPYLRVANVYFNRLVLDEIKEIGVTERDIERTLLHKGDLLFVEGNGSKSQIGRVAIWNDKIKNCLHQNHLIKSRLFDGYNNKYVLFFYISQIGRNIIEKVASSTSGLYTLNITKIKSLEIIIPNLPEQNKIVQIIEEKVSVCDKLEETIDESLEKSEFLRQSILKKAFSGELTKEWRKRNLDLITGENSAENLLKRIKAEKEAKK